MNKILITLCSSLICFVGCQNKKSIEETHKIVSKKQDLDTNIVTTPLVIWYKTPSFLQDSTPYSHSGSTNVHGDAESKGWEEALPIGNGRMAAMVFGGIKYERIQLNEESLWSYPVANKQSDINSDDYKEIQGLIFDNKWAEAQAIVDQKFVANPNQSPQYEPLSDLMLEMTDIDASQATDYYRDLHIDSAIATVHYHVGEKLFTREIFASYPANLIVMKISCNIPASINAKISLLREADAETFRSPFDSTLLIQRGKLQTNGLQFETQVKAVYQGGTVRNETKKLVATNVDELYLYISGATSFINKNYALFAKTNLINAIAKPYLELKSEHIADFKNVFNTVELNLNFKDKAYDIATDARMEKVKSGTEDKYLTELMFQYGRYLLICSSRNTSMMANMQGKWNEHLKALNGSGYKLPYTLPFIYSFADAAGLADLKNPLYFMADSIVKCSAKISKNIFGADGAFAFDNLLPSGNIQTQTQSSNFVSPLGLAWLSNSLLDTYKYNQDEQLLKTKIYPFLKQASLFVSNMLVEAPQGTPLAGKLVVNPSTAYGNIFKENATVGYASALDQTLARDLIKNTLYAINELSSKNYKFDPNHKLLLENTLSKLAITDDSCKNITQTWLSLSDDEGTLNSTSFDKLYQIYPSNYFINPTNSTELVKILKSDLLLKSKNNGFSNAYYSIIMARLMQANEADNYLLEHVKSSVSKNLLASNPPFSLEGNSLFTNAVTEMLLQSYNGILKLAPALPTTWEEGNFKGFKAQGGFMCNLQWKGNKFYANILSTKGKICKIKSIFPLKIYSSGTEVEYQKTGKDLYVFNTNEGASYNVTYTSNGKNTSSKGLGIWPDLGINLGLGF